MKMKAARRISVEISGDILTEEEEAEAKEQSRIGRGGAKELQVETAGEGGNRLL